MSVFSFLLSVPLLLNCTMFQMRIKKSMNSFKTKYSDILTNSVYFFTNHVKIWTFLLIQSILHKH